MVHDLVIFDQLDEFPFKLMLTCRRDELEVQLVRHDWLWQVPEEGLDGAGHGLGLPLNGVVLETQDTHWFPN